MRSKKIKEGKKKGKKIKERNKREKRIAEARRQKGGRDQKQINNRKNA